MKITLGVTTYGMLDRELAFLRSFWNNTENAPHEVSLVCVDDGTPDAAKVRERESAVRRLRCDFIKHETTLGQLRAGETILRYALTNGSQLCGLFDDTTCFVSPGWLSRLLFFFERNEKIGLVGLPLVDGRGFSDHSPQWKEPPVLACEWQGPVVLETARAELLEHSGADNWGVQLAMAGYPSFVLPWPPVYKYGCGPGIERADMKLHRSITWLDKDGAERTVEM